MQFDLDYRDEGRLLTDPALYAGAARRLGEAEVLPPVAFRSKSFAELEDARIWTRSWVAVGTRQQIPSPGDLLPFTVGFHGLHVQRMADGSLTGRFNKAQHGGCRSVPLQCQTGRRTRCSFTSCGHSRDRDVIRAGPGGTEVGEMQQYLGLRPERLLPLRVATWGPFIFVNLDPAAPPLEQELGDLQGRFAARLGAPLRLAWSAWVEVAANWKLVGAAHGAALPPAALVSTGPTHLLQAAEPAALRLWLFPNLLLAVHATHIAFAILQPNAMDACLQRTGILAAEGAPEPWQRAWMAELEAVGLRATGDQRAADTWQTSSCPESFGTGLPRQRSAAGHALQRWVIGRILEEEPA